MSESAVCVDGVGVLRIARVGSGVYDLNICIVVSVACKNRTRPSLTLSRKNAR